ncbi:hypothetical protein J6590_000272 [Homalodisca vitripennis]|nr:hypothetical protein J6590_096930 [Homalodisca vitripennis]KAG8338600.1 hypothetical protein J6590_000272 [Homalodisca vitripennis]
MNERVFKGQSESIEAVINTEAAHPPCWVTLDTPSRTCLRIPIQNHTDRQTPYLAAVACSVSVLRKELKETDDNLVNTHEKDSQPVRRLQEHVRLYIDRNLTPNEALAVPAWLKSCYGRNATARRCSSVAVHRQGRASR